jgi:hypothetical protein
MRKEAVVARLKVLPRRTLGWAEENTKHLSQDSRSQRVVLMLGYSDYEAEALRTRQQYLVTLHRLQT